MMPLTSLPGLKETIINHNLVATKKLGQNFLLNLVITRRIARVAGDLTQVSVIEIGPGPGGLTRAIAENNPHQLFVIERDERCLTIMAELQGVIGESFQIIHADALTIKPQTLTSAPLKIIANLPYNIGTVLLTNWLQDLNNIVSLTLMFQKEVALRLIAKPRTKDYGRLSVITQFLTKAEKVFDLPPGAFSPPPKVSSSVVHLTPKILTETEKGLVPYIEKITQAAFGQRRKMLRSSLSPLLSADELVQLGIAPTARAEELPISDFVKIAEHLRSLAPKLT